MELWIRSQDKETLIKIDRLDVDGSKIQANFKSYFSGCDYVILGTYKTKERALEVLDEIHDRIATLTTIDLMGLNDTNLKVFNEFLKEKSCSVVYQMPEE